ncbi:aspartyl-phosphate phosphatase Spo0E family protein [Bacillus sp. YZJH907-2]|uniref:Aspartyl-phosphate phosphatase Spo0E family protein n=1 Tax=Halalkalibacter suaedae TaxID=2822140 RepID=A0A940WY72_9BACI|nr:aspartyl-phosphate phosphatase Spo0E family protein [Bacillus suaedae]
MMIKIEEKRSEMLSSAKKYGFTSEITVQCSQELDKLLNAVQMKLNK